MTTIRLLDARRGLNRKCEELFGDAKIAEAIYRYLCDGIEECEDALTIDAVEVVLCKDCKYLDQTNYRCNVWNQVVYTSFDFCSRAERKDGV